MRSAKTSILMLQLVSLITLSFNLAKAKSNFEGDVVLYPTGCESQEKCLLVFPIRFTDSSGLVWEAPGGEETDGASIPPFFRPILGQPFQANYIKSALIHDHYCGKPVRDWFKTQKAFYEGLLDQGVPTSIAKTLLYGVLLGGPKWYRTVPGSHCGKNCINNVTGDSKERLIFQAADYEKFDMDNEISNIHSELESEPDKYSVEQLKQLAMERRQRAQLQIVHFIK